MVRKIQIKGYKRKGYKKDVIPGKGRKIKYIKPTTVRGHFKVDKGKPGRTPKSKRWFQEAVQKRPPYKLGWKKDEPQLIRLKKSLLSRPKSWSSSRRNLSASRALIALSNVTTDVETKRKARLDAKVLRRRL